MPSTVDKKSERGGHLPQGFNIYLPTLPGDDVRRSVNSETSPPNGKCLLICAAILLVAGIIMAIYGGIHMKKSDGSGLEVYAVVLGGVGGGAIILSIALFAAYCIYIKKRNYPETQDDNIFYNIGAE